MTTMRISNQDIERLVQGNGPENEELARLGEALQNWQTDFTRTPTDEQIAAFASRAAFSAKQTRPKPAPKTTTAPSKSRFRAIKYKLATGMAAVVIASGMTGVAVASDGAAPGDALYGLDRALESVGINNGGATERISEAQTLFAAGLIGEALEHAAEAFEDDDTASEAVNALTEAAERVAENGNAANTPSSVAEMLQAMATTEKGPGFGEMVSNMAKNINGKAPENAGPPSELPDQSNGDPKGNSSENSGEPGRGNQGNQRNQGPPDEPPGQSGKDKAKKP